MIGKLALISGSAAVAALLAAIVLGGLGRSHVSDKAFAVVTPPTNTPGPTPTPKPANAYGLWDIEAGPALFHCIARTDQDPVTLQFTATADCYSEDDAVSSVTGAEPPCDAVLSTAATAVPVVAGEGNCNGRVSPPPYSSRPPVTFAGSHDSLTDTVSYTGCFASVGGTYGPNIIVQFLTFGASTSANVYYGQTNANCSARTPSGASLSYPVSMTAVDPQRDYDGDGCRDAEELWADAASYTGDCGDDPWNPFDHLTGSPPDVTGSWDILMEAARADVGAAGFYYECKSDIQQQTKNLTAGILCYVDSPVVTVNPQVAARSTSIGVNNCPPYGQANQKFCGDGLPAAAPPGCNQVSAGTSPCTLAPNCTSLPCSVSQYQFADIDAQETQLTGTLNNTTHNIELSGCLKDFDGFGQLGSVVVRAKIHAYTGAGIGNLYLNQSVSICDGPDSTYGTADDGLSPSGAPSFVRISAVRQAPGPKTGATTTYPYGCIPNLPAPGYPNGAPGYSNCRDSDGDGCPDKMELANTANQGGLRDPLNRWDFFNPEKVNTPYIPTVADILKVLSQFGINQGNLAYTIDTDRTGIIGGNAWNLGPPDGQQTIADVLAANAQFNHNC